MSKYVLEGRKKGFNFWKDDSLKLGQLGIAYQELGLTKFAIAV